MESHIIEEMERRNGREMGKNALKKLREKRRGGTKRREREIC